MINEYIVGRQIGSSAGFHLGSLFPPEDGGYLSSCPSDYKAPCPRRRNPSEPLLSAAQILHNIVQQRMASPGMSRRVALVTTDVSEELSASFIRVTRIGELGTMVAVTSNRSTCKSVASYR
jgi:hypothetical protein